MNIEKNRILLRYTYDKFKRLCAYILIKKISRRFLGFVPWLEERVVGHENGDQKVDGFRLLHTVTATAAITTAAVATSRAVAQVGRAVNAIRIIALFKEMILALK